MKPKLLFCFLVLQFSIHHAISQHSGNEAYNQGYNYSGQNKSQNIDRLYLNDSAFLIKASVLYNVIADNYVAVFGLSQESATLKDCNEKINTRISGFKASLQKIGITAENIYTDMTTQNKIYDYKMVGNVAEEYLQGFELKKNVIIRFKNINDLEKMAILAADFQIYDLVKVDYLVEDVSKIYAELFKSATEIINQKKTLYVAATNIKLLQQSQLYGESFYSYAPGQLYKSYLAFESGEISAPYRSNITTKEVRKSKTFYYSKIDYSGFDRIINPSITEPAIEFILDLEIRFQIEKQKK